MYGTYCRLNLHVLASNRALIKAASRIIRPEFRYSRESRAERHKFYRQMIEYHEADAAMFIKYRF